MGSAQQLVIDSSLSAVHVKAGETAEPKNYILSVGGLDETQVDVQIVIGKFSGTDSTPKMTITITNSPKDKDTKEKLFSLNVEFTASIESRKEKKTTDVKTVTWSFYRLSVKQAS